jgi:hypothetical protein
MKAKIVLVHFSFTDLSGSKHRPDSWQVAILA